MQTFGNKITISMEPKFSKIFFKPVNVIVIFLKVKITILIKSTQKSPVLIDFDWILHPNPE